MEVKILYEDKYVLALDKPSGLSVHGDGRSGEKTLVDWINENYPELKEVGEPLNTIRGKEYENGKRFTVSVVERPGIVHRLDKETSGIIIVAKTKETHAFLKEQFQNRKIQKIYNAVVWGKFAEGKTEGVIDKAIGRSRGDFRKWSAEHGAKGELREAVTEYKVLAQGSHLSLRVDPLPRPNATGGQVAKERIGRGLEGLAYLEVRPKTGRTHQIRVHLKSISHPVVCDKLYGPKRMDHELIIMNHGSEVRLNRLMLHAVSIKLELPNHTHITIESPLPGEFEKVKTILSR